MNELAIRSPAQLVVRSKIDRLESSLRKEIDEGNMVQTIVDCKKDNSQAGHFFGDGVYARSLLIPAGTTVVGYIHKQARVCIVASGKCTFTDEFHRRTVEGPWVGEFKAGTKTAVYAHTDTFWVAVIGTDLKDPDILVDKLVTGSHEDYENYVLQLEDKSE